MTKIKMECTVKKWGNSVGVILPGNIVKEMDLKPNDKIRIDIEKGVKGKDIWNLLPKQKRNAQRDTQKIVDELKKGWD
jgi:antitoxin component of MazEF toxin-antitoxin module